jgi:hypothetical protein
MRRSGVGAALLLVACPLDPRSIGGDPETLRANAGREVEVSGTLQAQQQIATSGTATPRPRASRAQGSPAVQTDTQLDVKRLTVGTIRPMGEKCPSNDQR